MPGAVAALSGAQLRAHRILGSGLARAAARPAELPIWDLGMQDRDGSSRLAIATRLADRPLSGLSISPAEPADRSCCGRCAARRTCIAGPTPPGSPRRSGRPTMRCLLYT